MLRLLKGLALAVPGLVFGGVASACDPAPAYAPCYGRAVIVTVVTVASASYCPYSKGGNNSTPSGSNGTVNGSNKGGNLSGSNGSGSNGSGSNGSGSNGSGSNGSNKAGSNNKANGNNKRVMP